MAILDFTTSATLQFSRSGNHYMAFADMGHLQKQQPAVGLRLRVANQVGNRVIIIRFALPIEAMRDMDIRSQNEDWLKERHPHYALRKALQRACANHNR